MKKEVNYFVTMAVAEILITMLNTVVVVIMLAFMQLVIFIYCFMFWVGLFLNGPFELLGTKCS